VASLSSDAQSTGTTAGPNEGAAPSRTAFVDLRAGIQVLLYNPSVSHNAASIALPVSAVRSQLSLGIIWMIAENIGSPP
jgi:hypothetical protein